ncbi:MAG: acyl-CoA dehydrogenase [Actinomycetia bacterium]|nr:acyl-CoA dehydrogenase [Actinomycetes bacterium]
MADEVLPLHADYARAIEGDGAPPPWMADLRARARGLGLWNLALPDLDDEFEGQTLSNLEFAPICELIGKVPWASEAFNCQAPDVPNAAALLRYANDDQRTEYLAPLLAGDTRSAFSMTEPAVASSDATNIETRIERHGDRFRITGHKWYITGAAHPDCAFHIVLGVTDPDADKHRRHSCVIVPASTPGILVSRENKVLGLGDTIAPVGEIHYDDVEVPVESVLGEIGAGFAVAQVRLGPARVHHCLRLIGACESMIELMAARADQRRLFGRSLADFDATQHTIARCRVEVQQARLLTYQLAHTLDTQGELAARQLLSMTKVAVSETAHQVANRAVHLFGARGLSSDTPLAGWLAYAHMFLVGDGPTETHLRQIHRFEPEPDLPVAEVLDLTWTPSP